MYTYTSESICFYLLHDHALYGVLHYMFFFFFSGGGLFSNTFITFLTTRTAICVEIV